MSIVPIDPAGRSAAPTRQRRRTPQHRSTKTIEKLALRTRTALELPAGLSFEEWRDFGLPMLEAAQSIMWWIGDWLKYGERAYGSTYTLAAELTGLEVSTLADAKWVAASVAPSVRTEELSWTHHRLVASLEPDGQAELLAAARASGWSVQDLRAEVRRRRATPTAESARLGLAVVVADEHRDVVAELLDRVADGVRTHLNAAGIVAEVARS